VCGKLSSLLSSHPEDVATFLKAYPNGQFAPAARLKLQQLQQLAAQQRLEEQNRLAEQERQRREREAAEARQQAEAQRREEERQRLEAQQKLAAKQQLEAERQRAEAQQRTEAQRREEEQKRLKDAPRQEGRTPQTGQKPIAQPSPQVARLEPENKLRVREAVVVPAVTLQCACLGNPWTAQVTSFRMDLNPVSNREFLAFVQTHPQWKKSQIARDRHDGDYLKHWPGDDRVPAPELDQPVRYVSYYVAVAYCKEQGAKLPLLNHYRVASSYREGSIEIDYATSYDAPAFHFMQAEWTNTWWDSSGPRDPGKRLPYMYRTIHSGQKGSSYSPEQENRYTGGSLGFRCMQ